MAQSPRVGGPNKLPNGFGYHFCSILARLAVAAVPPLFAGHLCDFCGRERILVVNALGWWRRRWGSIVLLPDRVKRSAGPAC